ncbi:SAM-dependent methyltransferase [archaeon]|nr:SAM-dependent methyltransferase [archaeon]|tara:strand:+ start:1744 stop:2340 length:597 start_codon:yes stop_codon:yes gene_type:complete
MVELDLSDWEKVYKKINVKKLPWFNPKLDFDIQEGIEKYSIKKSSILNLGEGPGTQAIELTKLGFKVTASDISKNAIEKAKKLAIKKKVKIDFKVDDILDTKIRKKFDYISDRGCFHVLDPEQRETYIKNVHSLLNKKGYLFLKCFSHKEKSLKPYGFRPSEIEFYFKKFKILDIIETSFSIDKKKKKPLALFVIMKK